MKSFLKKALIGSAGFALFSSSAMAAWTFSDPDLVIGFQALAGQGSTTNLFFNAGNSYNFANGTGSSGLIGNINDDLVATYGASWNTRTDLYFGVIGNRSNLSPGSPTFETGIPGVSDPGRTVYVSAAATTVGGAALRPQFGSSTLGNGASKYAGLRTNLPGFSETVFGDGVASLNQTTQPVAWNNGWTFWNPTPGAAFGVMTGGIQQKFGQAGTNNIVDIQRMVASTPSVYVGSFIISDNGNITAISAVPETSSSVLAIAIATAGTFRRRRNRA